MQIDRRVTNGLAWAGVLLVVGIPTADLLSAQFLGDPTPVATPQIAVVQRIAPVPAPLSQRPAAPVEPETQVATVTPAAPVVVAPPAKSAVQVAAVTPTKPVVTSPTVKPAADTVNAVNAWLDAGKPLPSYITDEPSAAQPTQVAVTPPVRAPIVTTPAGAPIGIDPVQVASIQQPPKIAPMPMPLSMRPTPVAIVRPGVNSVPVTVGPNNDLIVATPGSGPRPPANIDAQELEDWESGPLTEFLAERQGSRADVTYDDDGFFLDQGPNRQPRRDRVIGPADDFFFPFFE